jgi:transposase
MVTPAGKLYFNVKRGTVKAPDVVAFLREVMKKFRRTKLLIIWDGARTHTSEEVKMFLRNEARGRIQLVRLPPYSPQLNADEQVHGIIKTRDFENRLFTTLDDLESKVISSFEALASKPRTVAKFFHHKEVGFYSE